MTPSAADRQPVGLFWFRDDLRLADNQALTALADWAADHSGVVVGLFVHEDPDATTIRPLGGASRWWQRASLDALRRALSAFDVPLIELAGDPRTVVPDVVDRLGAAAVSWSRRYHKPFIDVDTAVKEQLKNQGVEVHSFPGYLLTEPWEVRTNSDTAYKVYTPFSKAAGALVNEMWQPPLPVPEHLAGPGADASEINGVEPGFLGADVSRQSSDEPPQWATKILQYWTPGEEGAAARLAEFRHELGGQPGYDEGRDFPATPVTSRLSPHLRFGEISPRSVWAAAAEEARDFPQDVETFHKELLWRDFAWHRLHEHPDLATRNVRQEFDAFPWAWPGEDNGGTSASVDEAVQAWKTGRTGIPIVDAGMRELWETGTMHNRVRMIVGSLLTKNLGVHWQVGERWFWDTLVDADFASNPFNWQWVAGCGDDASPYFRIFNPETQQKKFDADQKYISTWVPEAALGPLSGEYPAPIVDLKESRAEALEAYQLMKDTAAQQ